MAYEVRRLVHVAYMLEQFAKYCSFVFSFARCVMIVIVIIWRVVGFVWFSVNVLDCVML